MAAYLMIRGGEIRLRLHNPTIKADGTIWQDGMPTIDGESPEAKEIGRAKLAELIKAHRYDEIPAAAYARVGLSATGLRVVAEREWQEERRREGEAKITPAEREYAEIMRLRYEGERITEEWGDEADTGKGYHMIAKAKERLAAWRAKYPVELAAKDAEDLRSKAAERRRLATGALVYDADGWLDESEQQRRHDELIAEAMVLEERAKVLEPR